MRYWKKPDSGSRYRLRPCFLSTCLALLFCCPPNAAAEGISIDYASSKLVENAYLLDAKISFDFDEELMVALEHGVELNIDILVRVLRKRKWLWDPVVAKDTIEMRLQHHPLSDDYVVTHLSSDTRHQFPSADAALRYLGSLTNHFLLQKDSIRNDAAYRGRIRARLNIDLLPAPLQPIAYVSKEWHLQSPWYEWVIR